MIMRTLHPGVFSVGVVLPPQVYVLIQRSKTSKRTLEAPIPIDALTTVRISLTKKDLHPLTRVKQDFAKLRDAGADVDTYTHSL